MQVRASRGPYGVLTAPFGHGSLGGTHSLTVAARWRIRKYVRGLMRSRGDRQDDQRFDAGNDAAGVVLFFEPMGHPFGGCADRYGGNSHADGVVRIRRSDVLWRD